MTVTLLLSGLVVAVVVAWVLIRYNGLVRLRNRLDNAWEQVDIQLTRRHDVVATWAMTLPAQQRSAIVEAVERARARAGAPPPERATAEADLVAVLARAAGVASGAEAVGAGSHLAGELHPRLAEELGAVDAQVLHAQAHHDATVRRYNTRRGPGPSALVARALGAGPRHPFTDLQHRPLVLGIDPAIREQRSA